MNIELASIKERRGLVATVCTSGDIKPHFAIALSNMRDWNSRNGLVNIEYRIFDAKLVESGRDAVASHALQTGYEWFLMADADAGPWPADATAKMLFNVFVQHPQIDVLGGYAQLKPYPHLPTIDTGTGKWEVVFPGLGIVPVIRTGGHFLMVKTGVLKRFGPPWFRTRIPYAPAKAFREVDNFARTQLDGSNPLKEHPEWETLVAAAAKTSRPEELTNIGEDSGFCDAVKAAGGTIAVDTDLVVGHVGTKVILPEDLLDAMRKDHRKIFAMLGVLGYE